MALTANDIVSLRPEPCEVKAGVRYAVFSGVPYTYNRMDKDAWRRLARIARGKVNEAMIGRYLRSLGIEADVQVKSYQKHDAFDFTIKGRANPPKIDVKSFHVLTALIKPPRSEFAPGALFPGVDATSSAWQQFFPMLVPQDQPEKDAYVFAVSVEAKPDHSAPVLEYPWMAFPDDEKERFLVDRQAIAARVRKGGGLQVDLSWPPTMTGSGDVLFEACGGPGHASIPFTSTNVRSISTPSLTSFLTVRLDDAAQAHLRKTGVAITLCAKDGPRSTMSSRFGATRFHEVFPRQAYTLYLVGWINHAAFESLAKPLPKGTPCYFYPPKQRGDRHEPSTKTANRYVPAGVLNPIATLKDI